MKYLSKKTEDTLELGEKIGNRLSVGMVVALEGDLGGGKTTFTKGLAKGLGIKESVTSPTFTLEKIYQLAINNKQLAKLYHFDFYRIDNPKDMVSYELTEALEDPNGIVVVEWAEKIEKELPKEKLVVEFHYKSENERVLELKVDGADYKQLIKNLKIPFPKNF